MNRLVMADPPRRAFELAKEQASARLQRFNAAVKRAQAAKRENGGSMAAEKESPPKSRG